MTRSRRLGLPLAALFLLHRIAAGQMPPATDVAPAQADFTAAAWRSDAPLRDVCFIDAQRGWAVGGQGTILATRDGGQHWLLCASPTAATLESVAMVDAANGWAAGGAYRPLSRASAAVLLRTRDGGQSWQPEKCPTLPALSRVQGFNRRQGWAFGEPSALHPSGLFATDDGAESWTPLATSRSVSWLVGDFGDPLSGIVCGDDGTWGQIGERRLRLAELPSTGGRLVRAAHVTPQGVWLVGEGGLVLHLPSGEQRWENVAAVLPAGSPRFDWHAIATYEEQIWIAGTPGTQLLHSSDAGHTWKWQATGQALPLDDLHFVDAQRGCAVGALGTILGTTDGGQSWQRTHSGGARVAVLAIVTSPREIPWEALAQLAGDDGYLAAIHVVTRELAATCDEARLSAAALANGISGISTSWQFPRREPSLAIGAEAHRGVWRATAGPDPDNALRDELVRLLRMWRPDVVLTGAPTADPDALENAISQACLAAVEAAGAQADDPLAAIGLGPWQVQRVWGLARDGEGAGMELATGQLSLRLGHTLREQADVARQLLGDRTRSPALQRFNLLTDRTAARRGGDLMAGLDLAPGGEARRSLPLSIDDAQALLRVAQRTRNLEALLAQRTRDVRAGEQLLARAETLTSELDPRRAATVLYRLGEEYHHSGRFPLAAEVYELLLRRYPMDDHAAAARLWLVQYAASSEAAWRTERFAAQPVAPVDFAAFGARSSEFFPDRAADPADVQPAAAVEAPGPQDRFRRALAAGETLRAVDVTLAALPEVEFPLAAARRALEPRTRSATGETMGALFAADPQWSSCAATETFLRDPHGQPPKQLGTAHRTTEKPYLDGQLDDAVWRTAAPLALTSTLGDDATWPAVALIAYDDEYLYLAASCRRADGARYVTALGPRSYDDDLATHDRVIWTFDVDRDWVTAYQLAIDHRGHPQESCWGDDSWNPPWFVASQRTETTWQIEAAIAWNELVEKPPVSGDTWALGIQRVVPGVGLQSWTQPAAVVPILPAGGLLRFE
ncbi:MAG: hypothetical protein K1X74_14385 [Pirellulales bacterium]|nr:hypothetical protein [Pirellulales bacterium]